MALPSDVAAGISGGLFHVLHMAAAGGLTAGDLDVCEPVYGGGAKGSPSSLRGSLSLLRGTGTIDSMA